MLCVSLAAFLHLYAQHFNEEPSAAGELLLTVFFKRQAEAVVKCQTSELKDQVGSKQTPSHKH